MASSNESIAAFRYSRRSQRALRSYWYAATAAICLCTVVAVAFDYVIWHALLAMLMFALLGYTLVRYKLKRDSIVPTFPIISAAFVLQFAVPAFVSDHTIWLVGGYKEISDSSITIALLLSTVSFIAFLLVGYSKHVNSLTSRLPRLNLHVNETRALIHVLICAVLGFGLSRAFNLLNAESQAQFGALAHVLANQALIGVGILGWLTYATRRPWLRLFYYAYITAAVIDGLSSGFLEGAIAPVGIMFASQWIYEGRVNKRLAAALLTALVLLNPVKADFREATWARGSEMSAVEKAFLWIQTATSYWSDAIQGRLPLEESTNQLIKRTSMIEALAHVYDSTPEAVPYYGGQTYSFFAYSFIPRFVWPEKPVASANTVLAVDYGLTTAEGAQTSTFGISLLGEAYANFGPVGPIIAMIVLALILRILERLFASTDSGPGGYAIYLAFFIFFLNGLGSSAEILLGNLFQSMAFSFLLIYWAVDRRSGGNRT